MIKLNLYNAKCTVLHYIVYTLKNLTVFLKVGKILNMIERFERHNFLFKRQNTGA